MDSFYCLVELKVELTYHRTLILRVHPPGILVSNGVNSHGRDYGIELSNGFSKLIPGDGDVLLPFEDFGEVVEDKVMSLIGISA